MNFFNSIERGFQDFGNVINNEVIQPAGDALDPTKNGFIDAFDPNKNGFTNTFDPHKGNFNMRFDPNKNGFNDALDPNKNGFIDTFDPHKGNFNNAFDPNKNGLSDIILKDPNIKRIANDRNIKRTIRTIKTTSMDDALNQIKDAF